MNINNLTHRIWTLALCLSASALAPGSSWGALAANGDADGGQPVLSVVPQPDSKGDPNEAQEQLLAVPELQVPEGSRSGFTPEEEALLGKAFDLYERARVMRLEHEASMGEKAYASAVEHNRLNSIDVAGEGEVRLTTVDGGSTRAGQVIIQKVELYEQSGVTYLFLDQNKISADSEHLLLYIARLKMEQRHVMLVWHDGDHFDLQSDARPTLFTKNWPFLAKAWQKTWGRATTSKRIDTGAIIGGIVFGGFQFGVGLVSAGIKYASDPSEGFSFAPALISLATGTTIGVINNWYRNWVSRAPRPEHESLTQTLKSSTVAAVSGYALILFGPGRELQTLSIFDLDGVFTHLKIFANSVVDSYVGMRSRQFNILRERLGMTRTPFYERKDPHGREDRNIRISRSTVEYESLKLGRLLIRQLDLMGIPLGTALFYLSPFFAQWATVKYAEAHHEEGFQDAPKYRAAWDKTRRLEFLYPRNIWSGIKHLARFTSQTCSSLLAKNRKPPEMFNKVDKFPNPDL